MWLAVAAWLAGSITAISSRKLGQHGASREKSGTSTRPRLTLSILLWCHVPTAPHISLKASKAVRSLYRKMSRATSLYVKVYT